MDYINYVKQSPMMGQIGLGGGATSLGRWTSAAPSGPRGVWGGGSSQSTIDYVTIATTGNASSFGTLYGGGRRWLAGCSNGSRGLFGGGYNVNYISYITIASTGNSQDFGDLTVNRYALAACSSNTRGTFAADDSGGADGRSIDYVTIASTGNASDFGDLTTEYYNQAGLASNTRGVYGGGTGPSTYDNSMEYITMASTGDATDFGNLTVGRRSPASCDNDTRGCFVGGESGSNNNSTTIDYITIASTGNATDFGDTVNQDCFASAGGADSDHGVTGIDRGVIGGGYDSSTGAKNHIQYITISSTGNATDFGDLTRSCFQTSCVAGL